MNRYRDLFTPCEIGGVRLKNRIAMAPMGIEYMTAPDGSLNRRTVDFYLERIRHGVGLVICSTFKAENRIEALEESTPMITEESLDALGEICDSAHAFGARIFVQLTAGFGRVAAPATLRGPCVSASGSRNFWDPSVPCRPLETEEVGEIAEAMGKTAALAAMAGADGIELHGHEGYLLDQFTTPLWNRREDRYGGSPENRLRFPVECLESIRRAVGNRLAVVYRFGLKHYLKDSASGALPGEEFEEAGRDLDQGLEMARRLEEAGFDALHVDAGCYESHYWPHPPNYQEHGCMLDMAAAAKRTAGIPVIGVGRLDDPEVAAAAVADGKLDVAAIGRGLLADPRWADTVRFGDPADIRPCVGCYDGCLEAYSSFRAPSCAVNPAAGRERFHRLEPAREPLDLLVVGGGVAGMEAARIAAIRGHRVTLCERGAELGGTVRIAAVPEFKADLRRLLGWYERRLEAEGVKTLLGTEATPGFAAEAAPDAVIVATGAVPAVPGIQGIERESVATCLEILRGAKETGERPVVVGGGLAGCEIAIWLAGMGKRPILVEALPELMSGGAVVPMQVRMMTRDLLDRRRVEIVTGSMLREVTDDGVLLAGTGEPEDRPGKLIEADSVVLSVGMRPEAGLGRRLEQEGRRTYLIGDCRNPRNVMGAVRDAFGVASLI